jgi:hypothetical protein
MDAGTHTIGHHFVAGPRRNQTMIDSFALREKKGRGTHSIDRSRISKRKMRKKVKYTMGEIS